MGRLLARLYRPLDSTDNLTLTKPLLSVKVCSTAADQEQERLDQSWAEYESLSGENHV